MGLFPVCKMSLELSRRHVVAGETLEGTVCLRAPERITHVETLEMAFITSAVADYGTGNYRHEVRETVFHAPLTFDLPETLEPGEHRQAFKLSLPGALPPSYNGHACSIEHELAVRVGVDWARDPKASFRVDVGRLPERSSKTPLTTRTGAGFHDSVIVELTLDSTTVVAGKTIDGSIAIRSGYHEPFDAIELSLQSVATLVTRGGRRVGVSKQMRIERERLRDGKPILFSYTVDVSPTFVSGFIDHNPRFEVTLDMPSGKDPSFHCVMRVLPVGSVLEEAGAPELGGKKSLRRRARAMANETGLVEGHPPVLVQGYVGPVFVRMTDAPKPPQHGMELEFSFPDAELGFDLLPKGKRDTDGSALTPASLSDRYVVRRREVEGAPPIDAAAVARFIDALGGRIDAAESLRMTGHYLAMRLPARDKTSQAFVELARFARERAATITEAISHPEHGLPFPTAITAARDAWQALASSHGGLLIPSRPAIHGIILATRTVGGEERVLRATLRAVWADGVPRGVRWDLDLGEIPLPRKVHARLNSPEEDTSGTEGENALRTMFSAIEAPGRETVALEVEGWKEDPREYVRGLEAFFAWLLEARGEQRAGSAYR